MTDETRILRTVGIPLVIAFVLLFVMPKMCARAVQVTKARQEQAVKTSGGLHIESSQKPVSYPAGLDADRVRALVEADRQFAAPYVARLVKAPTAVLTPAEQRTVASLQKLGFVQQAADGGVTLTREGQLHLEGLLDDGTAWSIPLAKRQFQSVTLVEPDTANARVGFIWAWEPTAAGADLLAVPKRHDAHAALTNASGRWTLEQISDLDSELE